MAGEFPLRPSFSFFTGNPLGSFGKGFEVALMIPYKSKSGQVLVVSS
jgi:hypothetical protein